VPGGALPQPIEATVREAALFAASLDVRAGRRTGSAIAVPVGPASDVSPAARLRALDAEHGVSTSSVAINLMPVPETAAGAPRTAIVRIENRAAHGLWAHVFTIDCSDRVSLVSAGFASGIEVASRGVEYLGTVAGIGSVGIRIPPAPCRSAALDHRCTAELVVIATTVPVDLRGLATPEPSVPAARDREMDWQPGDEPPPLQSPYRRADPGVREPPPVGFAVIRRVIEPG
jgi:hypothetical protein